VQRRTGRSTQWRRVASAAAIGIATLSAPAPAQAQRLSEVPVTRLDDGVRAELDAPRPVSITISEPLPLRDVLLLLFRGTAMSVVVRDGATGTFAGELRDLTLRQALETVLFPGGLDYDVRGPVVRVFPRRPETRFFELNLPAVPRASHDAVHTPIATEPSAGSSLTTPPADDVFAEIQRGVQALLSESGRSHVDRKAGLVHVTDFADRLDRVGLYIESATVRLAQQVRLQVRVLEVVGAVPGPIDWAAIARQPGSGIEHLNTAGMRVRDISALLGALGQRGTVREISAPDVVAMNNEPVSIRVGTEHPDPVVPQGLALSITPQISADGIVTMRVAPSFAEAELDAVREAGRAPVLHVTRADTHVRVQNGHTIVISGLLRERKTRPAGLTDSGGEDPAALYSELVVLLTPTVVSAGGAVER
jgi:MSHA biogenesis protein MshL